MKNTILIIFVLLCTITSCSDDILDLKPTDALSEDDVFSSPELATNFVNSIYNGVWSAFQEHRFQDAFTDNAYNVYASTNTWEYVTGAINADNGEVATKGLWSRSYTYIRYINIFFEGIEESEIDEVVKSRLSGEVNFIRACIYSELLKWYGGVPIIDKVFTPNDELGVPRSSYDDVVTYIVSNLDDAISKLPVRTTDGRANALAAHALKSRVLLYSASTLNNPTNNQSKWQAAKVATEAAIDLIGENALHNSYEEVFMQSTDETIWERQFTQSNGNKVLFENAPFGYPGGVGTTPIQYLIDAYEMDNGLSIKDESSGYDSQNPYVDRDPRFYASINYNGAIWKGRAVESFLGGVDVKLSVSNSGYHIRKWLNEDTPDEWLSELGQGETVWIFFRTAELYLNYAECFLELGDETNAKIWMNKTRSRVGMPDIVDTGIALVDRYRNERRVEFAFENHRLFDILRWKTAHSVIDGKPANGVIITKDGENLTYDYSNQFQDRFFLDKQYRFPIPREEIIKSEGVLEQNPEYN